MVDWVEPITWTNSTVYSAATLTQQFITNMESTLHVVHYLDEDFVIETPDGNVHQYPGSGGETGPFEIPLGANEIWYFQWVLLFYAEAAGGNLDVGVKVPTGCVANSTFFFEDASGGYQQDQWSLAATEPADTYMIAISLNLIGWTEDQFACQVFDVLVTNSTTAGNMVFSFEGNTTGKFTMMAGSTWFGMRLSP